MGRGASGFGEQQAEAVWRGLEAVLNVLMLGSAAFKPTPRHTRLVGPAAATDAAGIPVDQAAVPVDVGLW